MVRGESSIMLEMMFAFLKGFLGFFSKRNGDAKISVGVVNEVNRASKDVYKKVNEDMEKEIEKVSINSDEHINSLRVSKSESERRDVLRDRIKTINDRNKNSN